MLGVRLVLPFSYRLTWIVPDKGAFNGCVFLLDVLLFEIVHCCIRNSVTPAQSRFLVDDYPLIIAVVLK